MRVIAGSARRAKLKVLEGFETRPTSDKIKETLFNILMPVIYDTSFLDLFAGSGGIGIEALSRGAKEAVFVEKNPKAVSIIKENLKITHFEDNSSVLCEDFNFALSRLERNRKIVTENLDIVKKWVENEPKVSLIFPKYVSTSFIKLDIPINTEEFCIKLLKKKGVLLVPGNRFDMPGYARLGYCTHKDVLKKGLEKLSDYLKEFE